MRASGGARGPCDDVQAVASEAPLGTCFAQINPEDVCLTLTSGGCNSLHLCINGARKVGGDPHPQQTSGGLLPEGALGPAEGQLPA